MENKKGLLIGIGALVAVFLVCADSITGIALWLQGKKKATEVAADTTPTGPDVKALPATVSKLPATKPDPGPPPPRPGRRTATGPDPTWTIRPAQLRLEARSAGAWPPSRSPARPELRRRSWRRTSAT